ncbi:hypothetical protein TNCV_299671 [Trichonephila clavipes]|nr:hypothetical protein TNCV_299671 [Trichonephila clavipes]
MKHTYPTRSRDAKLTVNQYSRKRMGKQKIKKRKELRERRKRKKKKNKTNKKKETTQTGYGKDMGVNFAPLTSCHVRAVERGACSRKRRKIFVAGFFPFVFRPAHLVAAQGTRTLIAQPWS